MNKYENGGSMEISFLIDDHQFEVYKEIISYFSEFQESYKRDANTILEHYYSMILSNCYFFSEMIFQNLYCSSNERSFHFAQNWLSFLFHDSRDLFGAYYRAERMDLMDQGIFQIFTYSNNLLCVLRNIGFILENRIGYYHFLYHSSLYLSCSLFDSFTGNAAIHRHAFYGTDVDLFTEIIDLTDDINIQNHYGNTALHIAIERRNFTISHKLISNGADPTLQNIRGWTVLKTILFMSITNKKILIKRGV